MGFAAPFALPRSHVRTPVAAWKEGHVREHLPGQANMQPVMLKDIDGKDIDCKMAIPGSAVFGSTNIRVPESGKLPESGNRRLRELVVGATHGCFGLAGRPGPAQIRTSQ